MTNLSDIITAAWYEKLNKIVEDNNKMMYSLFDEYLSWNGSGYLVKWKGQNPNPEKEQLIKDMFNLFNGKVNNLQDEDISLYMMLTNKDRETTLSDIKKFQSYVIKAREENKLYGRESWKRRF